MAATNLLNVIVNSTDKKLYEGPARAVTSYNEQGLFDVLPYHSHFISIIKRKVTVVVDKETSHHFDVDGGVMHVLNNTVEVFLGIETLSI